MATPALIKIRAQLRGTIADIRVLMPHPMIPAHFIQTFAVTLNGAPLIDGQLNPSISRDPLFVFRAEGVKPGDRLAVHWTDVLGGQQREEVVVG